MANTGCDPLGDGVSCYSTYVREPANYDQAYVSSRRKSFVFVTPTKDSRNVTVRNQVFAGLQPNVAIVVYWFPEKK
jgi:hypothetical protein